MSLFGLGANDKGEPPRCVRRSVSANELGDRSPRSNSSRVADALFGGRDAEMQAPIPFRRKAADLSPSMRSGDRMREVMAHQSPWTSVRSSGCQSARRYRSLTPQCSTDNLRGDSDSEHGVFHSVSAANLDEHRRASPRLWDRSDGVSSDGHSPRAASVRSNRSLASTGGGCYNPRAKPGTAASEATRAYSAYGARHHSRGNEDHMWRGVFHEELVDRRESKLRGEGKAIGSRSKASTGIPWRQMPSYDNGGRLTDTGDLHHNRRSMVKASGMTEKKRGWFSPRMDNSMGVSELLSPVSENCENRPPPPPKIDSEAREAWLDVIKLRQDAKHPCRPRAQPDQQAPNDALVNGAVDPPPDLHWTWRQLRKSGSARLADTKDSCPFQREDSDGFGAKSMQAISSRSFAASPRVAKLYGAAVAVNGGEQVGHKDLLQSEQVVEARRDWQLAQDKWDRDDSMDISFHAQDASALGRSANVRSSLGRSASIQSFSAATKTAAMSPVHSIRARDNTFYKARWK